MESSSENPDRTASNGPRPRLGNKIMYYILGALIGGLVGFGYYRLLGCSTGACPLTSNPWISTIYGMVLGLLFAGSLH